VGGGVRVSASRCRAPWACLGRSWACSGFALCNILLIFIFKLLPVLGAHGYILIPYVVPEIAVDLLQRRAPRADSCALERGAVLGNLLTLFIRAVQYLEPTIGCIFIWSIGIRHPRSRRSRGGPQLDLHELRSLIHRCSASMS